MSESKVQRASLNQLFSDDPVVSVVGLLLSLLSAVFIGILGLTLGIKVILFLFAILLGYLFFEGAFFVTFVVFVSLSSGIMIFRFSLLPQLFVSVGPGEIAVLLIATFFTILCIKRVKVHPDPFKVPLLIIFAAAAISLTSSVNISVSLFVIGSMIFGYLLYRWMIQWNTGNISKLLDFVIFVTSFFIILCVLQYAFSPYRVEVLEKFKSVFGGRYFFILSGPNAVAGVLATLFPLVLMYIKVKRFPYRFLWVTIFILGIFILYITASRNGYLASTVTILVTVALITSKRNRILAVASALAVILFVSLVLFPSVMLRMTTIFRYELDPSALGRFILWQQALAAVKENLITGIGVGTFFYLPMSLNLAVAHNQFLNMLAETGIIGGAGYVILLYFIFRTLLRAYAREKKRKSGKSFLTGSLIASWIGFAIHNLFDGIWAAPHHTKEAMFFWLLLALTVIATQDSSKNTISDRQREFLTRKE